MQLSLNLMDIISIAPLLTVFFGAILILFIETFFSFFGKKASFYIAILTFSLAFIFQFFVTTDTNPLILKWVRFDPLSKTLSFLFLFIGFGSACLACTFFDKLEASRGEYYFLLLSSVFGLLLMACAADFLILFLGIETLSIASYILCGFIKDWKLSHEAALKYFFIGALATAFLLYGIALIYGAVGLTEFSPLLKAYHGIEDTTHRALFMTGVAFVTVGLAFKAAIVPFHTWAPDVYEGSPTPVTGFMAIGTKSGAFAAFILVFFIALPNFNPMWNEAIRFLIYPTLLYANFVALRQTELRRFFAYSGISHAGYLLIPFVSGGSLALSSVLFYLVIYVIATLGCFGVVAVIDKKNDNVPFTDLKGLFQRSPLLASILAFCLLTLAGIPPTPGFFAKFYIFKVAMEANELSLVIFGLLISIVAAFYYLRLIALMCVKETEQDKPKISWPGAGIALFSLALLLWLTFIPGSLLHIYSP